MSRCHGKNCPCSLSTRHEWFIAYCELRDKLVAMNAPVAPRTPEPTPACDCRLGGIDAEGLTSQPCPHEAEWERSRVVPAIYPCCKNCGLCPHCGQFAECAADCPRAESLRRAEGERQ
jgi:hypothetical protein